MVQVALNKKNALLRGGLQGPDGAWVPGATEGAQGADREGRKCEQDRVGLHEDNREGLRSQQGQGRRATRKESPLRQHRDPQGGQGHILRGGQENQIAMDA